MAATDPACGTCRFTAVEMADDGLPVYQCRRYPPQIGGVVDVGGGPEVAQSWPNVTADDWCGEHQTEQEGDS
jgi:hypothetical protein